MDLKLDGQIAVITGAASGIGRAIACCFAQQRAGVILIDRNARVQQLAEEITQRYEILAKPLTADVTQEADLREAAEKTLGWVDRCDHLVCAAGVGSGGFGFPFWNIPPANWQAVLDVNVLGVVHAAHAFVPAMIQSRHGSMLFLSSVAGQIGSQTDPPYSAAKAAVINFMQCAAKDLAQYDIRVNAICPGMIKTPLNQSVWKAWYARQPTHGRKPYEDWAAEKIEQVVPLNRWQEPEDVAQMAVFLASPCGKNITGQTINVDGGQVMHW